MYILRAFVIKSAILTFVLTTASLAAAAQARNSIYLEGFGKNIIGPALMYERSTAGERRLNLEWGAGLGIVYRSGFDEPENTVMSLPLQLGANLGRRHHKFEFGLAGFFPLGSYIEYEVDEFGGRYSRGYVIPFTLYLGYKRYPKAGNGLYFHANLQPLLNTSWIPAIPWAGIGIGYSFQKK